MNAKKKLEGQEHVRKAEKALKTSLLKWTPDYDTAGDEFSKAATAFKVGKAPDEALDALNRACECFKEIRSLYQAAKTLETSVLICRDLGRTECITDLAERGGLLYRQHGSPESASQLLEKAAKILQEAKKHNDALELYEKAAETILVEDRPKMAAEYTTKVARLRVKIEDYAGATEACIKAATLFHESGFTQTAGGVVAGAVLCHLVMEDSVAASKTYHKWGGCCNSDINDALQGVLKFYDEENSSMVKKFLDSSAIKNLDVEFALLARKVKVPEGLGAAAEEVARINREQVEEEGKTLEGAVNCKEEDESGDASGDELC